MRVGTFPPTRMGLLEARRRLARVEKGRDLLRRKREALVAELFRLARPAMDARAVIDQRARQAYPALARALAVEGRAGVRAAGWPAPDIGVDIRTLQVWGIPVAEIVQPPRIRRSLERRGTAPGVTPPATVQATTHFEILTDLLLSAAPREMLLRRLGEALSRTSRQVHALEQRVTPGLEAEIARITGALDQREREEHLRLRRFVRRGRPAPGR
jgi:V/A-type H+/Na+-transporting ATPase subunit D